MTPEEQQRRWKLFQLFISEWDGKSQWQCREYGEGPTFSTGSASPLLDWKNIHYRVPPQPKHEPWTFEDAPLTLKVRRKSDGELFRADVTPYGWELYNADNDGPALRFSELLADYEQLSGEPCGRVVNPEGDHE